MAPRAVETFDFIVFLAVARTGSFGAAADEIGLATPSVSSRMSALERKMAAELFTRTTHGSALTAAGRRLVPYAERSLILLQEARQAVRSRGRRRVVIGAPASLAAVVFPSVLTILGAESLSAHCRVAHSVELVGHILDGTVDAGFVVNQVVPATVATQHLCRSAVVAVCRPGHALARRNAVHVDDLLGTPVVVYRWGPDAEALAEVFEHRRPADDHPVHLVGLPTAVLPLVADGDHVGIMPEFALGAALRNRTLVALPLDLPGWSLEIQLAHRGDADDSAGVRALLAGREQIRSVIST
ncbi:LysR family transcriptional regulator [Pseudonocardia sichuanensis]